VADTSVAAVDSLTGLVTGRKPGTTGVELTTSVTHTYLTAGTLIVAP
jgi:hypothetical protein